jgi:hypothetical protein
MKQAIELKAEDYERLCKESGANYRSGDHDPKNGHIKALMPIAHKLKCDGLNWYQISRWFGAHGVSCTAPETIGACWRKHCQDWLPYVKTFDHTKEAVNHPAHYTQVPGIECIEVTRHFSFTRGNAIKYLWRAGEKGNALEDLQKAVWYIQDEITQLSK